jgi:hypothetical protein
MNMKQHNMNRTLAWLSGVCLAVAFGVASAQEHRGFASAQAAVDALIAALEAADTAALPALLGPDSGDILDSGDEVADANARRDFLERYKEKHALIEDSPGSMTLQVGANEWPLPIPVVQRDGQWYLDGAAGADELVYRRVGRNELGAIAVCRGFVDAQAEYAAEPRDGNAEAGVYAIKLRSDPDRQNGLYWPTAEGEAESPVGPAIARAAEEGYRAITGKRRPYHGYHYRMLYAQGASAPGGAMDYFENGLLTKGVALIAWPAHYGVSGVKSFIVGMDGTVYEKDLGEDTAATADAIQSFDPDSTWSKVEAEEG